MWIMRAIELNLPSHPAPSSPAHPPTLFSLSQLQKAAEPWVLKHSDLEKQDNSWKEVRTSPLPVFHWLPTMLGNFLFMGKVAE